MFLTEKNHCALHTNYTKLMPQYQQKSYRISHLYVQYFEIIHIKTADVTLNLSCKKLFICMVTDLVDFITEL